MNKAHSIRKKCSDCGGGPKEVSVCSLVDCALWLHRFGFSMNDQRFMLRMAKAKQNFPVEFQEMENRLAEYLKTLPNSSKKVEIANLLKKMEDL